MKQIAFAIPISKSVALADLERRCRAWHLPRLAYEVIERWYDAGWDDGIVQLDRCLLAVALGVRVAELDHAIELLQDLQVVRVRHGADLEAVELLALSTAHCDGSPYLGWWQVYVLEMEGYDE